MIQIKRITVQTHISLEALIQEKSSFMVQRVLHFRIYKATNSARTKSNKVLLFLFSRVYRHVLVLYDHTRYQLWHFLHFWPPFDPYDLFSHIALCLPVFCSRSVLEASSPSACTCVVDLIVAIELRIKDFKLGYFFRSML